ncbi:MAG: hypothetical protein JST39_17455, partial [Bacteroidetes bacterium]|nr:hypothetical protein [Bacteroidota bacterium]
KLHQSLDVKAPPKDIPGYFEDWEGWRKEDIDRAHAEHPYTPHSENGNVFVIFSKITHTKTNLTLLNGSFLLCALILLGFFIARHRRKPYDLSQIAMFGFCIYMLSDLFSPVWRHQYYTVQWLFPVLLAAANYRPEQRKWFIAIGLALLLNIVNIPFVKMEHTIGEYMLLLVLLYLSIFPTNDKQPEKWASANG